MLQLLPSDIMIVKGWVSTAMKKHGIPLPEEQEIINKINKAGSFRSAGFEDFELEVILMWAEQSMKSHHGGSTFIMEPEQRLVNKIHQHLSL